MPTIQILGSLSGTEPMPNRHHTSVVVTCGGRHYFFDAGENCSHLAHVGGVDLLNIRAIFISHVHYDHVGGLLGIIRNIRKIGKVQKRLPAQSEIPLFIPEIETWEAIKTLFSCICGNGLRTVSILAQKPKEGLFYEDETLKVFAFPAHHMPDREDGTCRSFSYRIELDGFSMVYSGDVGTVADFALPVGAGCDLLLAETGHHKVKDICDFAETHSVGELVFYHHGREVLNYPDEVAKILADCKVKTTVADDGTVITK